MTLHERLLYLADWIDDTRTFPNCVLLRRYFWGAEPGNMTAKERELLLHQTLLLSYDLTMKDLIADGEPIGGDTGDARNEELAILSALGD